MKTAVPLWGGRFGLLNSTICFLTTFQPSTFNISPSTFTFASKIIFASERLNRVTEKNSEMIPPDKLPAMAKAASQEHSAVVKRLAATDSRRFDARVHAIHDSVFGKIDCLECANCCRSLGPRVTDADVRRIAASLRIKPSAFVTIYLVLDEEGDFIFRSMPCPFLGSDNYCSIYDVRPKACREYPHTDQRRVYQVLPLMLKNSPVCPAVFEILEQLKKGDG